MIAVGLRLTCPWNRNARRGYRAARHASPGAQPGCAGRWWRTRRWPLSCRLLAPARHRGPQPAVSGHVVRSVRATIALGLLPKRLGGAVGLGFTVLSADYNWINLR